MIIVSASTLLCIAINLGKLALLSIAMAQPMIMAGGTWITLRKLRSIHATPASIEEAGIPIVPSLNDVQRYSGKMNASASGHGSQYTELNRA